SRMNQRLTKDGGELSENLAPERPIHSRTASLAKPTARSRVTNGRELLPGVDGRTLWVRRFRDVLALHLNDLGGESSTSEAEKALNDGATAWMAPNCASSRGLARFRTTATRVTRGAICLSNSSNFALRPNSLLAKPVALPAGRAKVET